MVSIIIPPALFLILGGFTLLLMPRWSRAVAVTLLPLLALLHIWIIPEDTSVLFKMASFTLIPIYLHPYTQFFASIFTIAAMVAGFYAVNHLRALEIALAFIYAGSAVGITFAGDFLTMFLYWELMAFLSTMIILFTNTEASRKAAFRYAFMHIFGGLLLLVGISGHISLTGDTQLVTFHKGFAGGLFISYADFFEHTAYWFVLAGILVNVGAIPFSAWLADSYGETTPGAAAFLTTFTSKTALFMLLLLFSGEGVLIPIGVLTMLYGIFYAMLDNDIRRSLCYLMVSQLGMVMAVIGVGGEMAVNAVAFQALASILYMLLLFMVAGSVIHMTGKRQFSELGGLCHFMPVTAGCCVVAALALGAFPFTAGFVGKSLLAGAVVEQKMMWLWLLMLAGTVGTVVAGSLRFGWFIFLYRASSLHPKDPPLTMKIPMLILAGLCLYIGLFPEDIYSLLLMKVKQPVYSDDHLVTHLQLLMFAGLSFFLFLPLFRGRENITLDFDWFYRKLAVHLLKLLDRLGNRIHVFALRTLNKMLHAIGDQVAEYHSGQGVFAGRWSIGTSTFWAVFLLGGCMVFYYTGWL